MESITRHFASDNYAGICPEALQYMLKANSDHDISYGNDIWTARVSDYLRGLFEKECEVFFVFNGTAANSLAISTLCKSYNSILCAHTAHIETDECGAPEFFTHGSKILHGNARNGKLEPAEIERIAAARTDLHFPKPRVISISQTTELGTVYTREDLLKISKMAKKYNLRIHMDGARFANAVAALDVSPSQITWECGVDVLCFGGSKNGVALGEAVIFFDKQLAEDFEYRCKQAGQLASKMRFVAAPWLGILETGAWLKYAKHANECARMLEGKLRELPEVGILFPCEANAVFVKIPDAVIDTMHTRGWHFYTFIGAGGARLMCSWDTTDGDVYRFVVDLKQAIQECR